MRLFRACGARYGPGMPDITIPGILLRTTSDGPGHVHGLAVANGLTLDQALATLAARAAARASEIAAAYRGAEHAGRPDAEWRFEVIDLRITAGPPDSGGETWVAYGTLRSQGADPWQASYWDNHP
jgi:hypothetical protein